MNPSDIFVSQYATAAASAAVFELKARLLADKTDGLEKVAHDRLEALVDAIVVEYALELAQGEADLLHRARRLRNKLLHSDLHDAQDILRELTPGFPDGDVHRVDLETGEVAPVAASKSTREGRVFGWLLEMGSNGAFLAAQRIFNEAIAIIERLVLAEVERHRRGSDCP